MSEFSLPTPGSIGTEAGELPGVAAFPFCSLPEYFLIDPPIEDRHWCDVCESFETFRAKWEGKLGRVGFCVSCETTKLAVWTRTNGEAA
jgi:hypothetical protein